MKVFEKFLGGKPFRAQCTAGWVMREGRGKSLRTRAELGDRVCGLCRERSKRSTFSRGLTPAVHEGLLGLPVAF